MVAACGIWLATAFNASAGDTDSPSLLDKLKKATKALTNPNPAQKQTPASESQTQSSAPASQTQPLPAANDAPSTGDASNIPKPSVATSTELALVQGSGPDVWGLRIGMNPAAAVKVIESRETYPMRIQEFTLTLTFFSLDGKSKEVSGSKHEADPVSFPLST